MRNRRIIIFMSWLLAAFLAEGCGGWGSTRPSLETTAFVELAHRSLCSDIRRRLFVIDESMVLFQRAGSCPDNSYATTLYGGSPAEILCTTHDSIAGPMTNCEAGAPSDLFDTMTQNADSPDLGLGSDHKVRSVPL